MMDDALTHDIGSDKRIIDNRVFLLGLDALFREAQKRYETSILLPIVRDIKDDLALTPQDVLIEGYYTETPELKEHFLLVRSLQTFPKKTTERVKDREGLHRLLSYTSSKIFGRSLEEDRFLPVMVDPLAEALRRTYPKWNIPNLTAVASDVAKEWNDVSLVGLACLANDCCVITALKESAVLYGSKVVGVFFDKRKPTYEWRVDNFLEEKANVFIQEFNSLTDAAIPLALPENAAMFYRASSLNAISGRCVNIGSNPEGNRFYHWAIEVDSKRAYFVKDFWDDHVWTTDKYRRSQTNARGVNATV